MLDVGCGTGRLSAYVADIVGRDGIVHAIDPLSLRVEIAQRIERSNLQVAVGHAAGVCLPAFRVGVPEDAGAVAEGRDRVTAVRGERAPAGRVVALPHVRVRWRRSAFGSYPIAA